MGARNLVTPNVGYEFVKQVCPTRSCKIRLHSPRERHEHRERPTQSGSHAYAAENMPDLSPDRPEDEDVQADHQGHPAQANAWRPGHEAVDPAEPWNLL
jgi:hypothetical protein